MQPQTHNGSEAMNEAASTVPTVSVPNESLGGNTNANRMVAQVRVDPSFYRLPTK